MNQEIPDNISDDMIEELSPGTFMRIRMDLVRLSDLLPLPKGRYFDPSNLTNLHRKMDVLSKLEQGIPIAEIPDWEDILDMPPEGTLWD